MINLVHKQLNFGEITFHHILFKNIEESNVQELTDNVASLLYDFKISLTYCFVCGDDKQMKKYAKATGNTFSDIDWPLTWINNPNQKTISGHYSGISGCTVKSISTASFKMKIADTKLLRFCRIGDISYSKKNKSSELLESIETALTFSGCNKNDIIQSLITYQELPEKDQSGLADWFPAPPVFIEESGNGEKKLSISTEIISSTVSDANLESLNEGSIIKQESNRIVKLFNIPAIKSVEDDDITRYFSDIAKRLEKEDLTWTDIKLGYLFAPDSKTIKKVKSVCKDLKVPLSPILFINAKFPDKNKMFEFIGEFGK